MLLVKDYPQDFYEGYSGNHNGNCEGLVSEPEEFPIHFLRFPVVAMV